VPVRIIDHPNQPNHRFSVRGFNQTADRDEAGRRVTAGPTTALSDNALRTDDDPAEATSMRLLTVRHVTVYRYAEPVSLGEHRMMFRPRASHDLRMIKTSLAITPEPTEVHWVDVNCVIGPECRYHSGRDSVDRRKPVEAENYQ
jgi:hypothetical protein